MRNKIFPLLMAGLVTLSGCGGGKSDVRPDVVQSPPQTEPELEPGAETTAGPAEVTTLDGFSQREANIYAFDPQIDLPSDGTDGIRVTRPQGAQVTINLNYADGIEARLEGPNWLFSTEAQERLQLAAQVVEIAVWTGYKQWSRHLDGTHTVDVLVGYQGIENCGHSAVACYIPALDKVVLGEQWLRKNYFNLHRGLEYRMEERVRDVFSELVFVATHEAAHQFGYEHPRGDTEGCGGEDYRCHAPIGSGSVASYDSLRGRSSRYAPDRGDVRHIDGGVWNSNAVDRYKVSKTPTVPSIVEFGYWLDHDFAVSGSTAPGQSGGGSFSVRNAVTVEPFITGTSSMSHELRGNASWSGDFVGYDLVDTEMTALTADVTLGYSFDTQRMDMAIHDFLFWQGDSSTSIGGRYEYTLACTSAICSYEQTGSPCLDGTATCGGISVQTRFYPHRGDPSAYAGGVVNDDIEKYAGAFAATKD